MINKHYNTMLEAGTERGGCDDKNDQKAKKKYQFLDINTNCTGHAPCDENKVIHMKHNGRGDWMKFESDENDGQDNN